MLAPKRRGAARPPSYWIAVPAPPSAVAPTPVAPPPSADQPAMPAAQLWRRVRHGRRLSPVRRHAPLAAALAGSVASRLGWRLPARALWAVAAAGWLETYRRGRRRGGEATAEHVRRMERLSPDVLRNFYITCVGSMEAELEEYPLYDQRKHELRYRRVSRAAVRYATPGAVVVDVGCASALVLDDLHRALGTRGVGFDLSPYGVHQRALRPDPPLLAQAIVEEIPLRDGIADVVVFSEVIEHVIDPNVALREVSRIMKPGGIMVLTTNNGSEMPVVSPLVDPLQWVERLLGRWQPRLYGFRNITWHEPINREADPLPLAAATYAPHFHFAFAELRDLATDAGFEVVSQGSFEYPAPQSPLAERLRRLSARSPRVGNLLSDALETAVAAIPGLNLMGTHHELVFRKVGDPLPQPSRPWWPAALVPGLNGAAPRRPAGDPAR
jgi:SAM-dependent methyltransferase